MFPCRSIQIQPLPESILEPRGIDHRKSSDNLSHQTGLSGCQLALDRARNIQAALPSILDSDFAIPEVGSDSHQKQISKPRGKPDDYGGTHFRAAQILERNRQKNHIIFRAIHCKHHPADCPKPSSVLVRKPSANLAVHPHPSFSSRRSAPNKTAPPDSRNAGSFPPASAEPNAILQEHPSMSASPYCIRNASKMDVNSRPALLKCSAGVPPRSPHFRRQAAPPPHKPAQT